MAGRLAQTMIWCGDGTKAHAARGVGRIAPPTSVRTRVVPPSGKPGTILHRTALLTPYIAETIGEDALRAGRGAGLELTVAADATAADVARVQEQFVWLGNRGVRVNVRRDARPGAEHAAETEQRPARGRTAGR